mgnify:CR=1 FL=1
MRSNKIRIVSLIWPLLLAGQIIQNDFQLHQNGGVVGIVFDSHIHLITESPIQYMKYALDGTVVIGPTNLAGSTYRSPSAFKCRDRLFTQWADPNGWDENIIENWVLDLSGDSIGTVTFPEGLDGRWMVSVLPDNADGYWYVGKDYSDGTLYAQRLNYLYQAFDEPVSINSDDTLSLGWITQVARFHSSNFSLIMWSSHPSDHDTGYLKGRIFSNAGEFISESILIAEDSIGISHSYYDVIANSEGEYIIAYSKHKRLENPPDSIFVTRLDSMGNRTLPAVHIHTAIDDIFDLELTQSENGDLLLIWVEEGVPDRILGLRFDADLNVIGEIFTVSELTNTYPLTLDCAIYDDQIFTVWSYPEDGTWANIIDYNNPPVSLGPERVSVEGFSIKNVFPSPFNSSFILEYSLEVTSPVDVTLYDIRGRKVYETSFDLVPPGDQSLTIKPDSEITPFNSSGVYLITVRSSSGFDTRKVVYLK